MAILLILVYLLCDFLLIVIISRNALKHKGFGGLILEKGLE